MMMFRFRMDLIVEAETEEEARALLASRILQGGALGRVDSWRVDGDGAICGWEYIVRMGQKVDGVPNINFTSPPPWVRA